MVIHYPKSEMNFGGEEFDCLVTTAEGHVGAV